MRRAMATVALLSICTGWLLTGPLAPANPLLRLQATVATSRQSDEAMLFALTATDRPEEMSALPNLTGIPGEQRKYLLSLQDETGAIAQTPEQAQTVPYFANMAALSMLSWRDGQAAVRRYLQWYVTHLNSRDRFGLTGTVYDYVRSGGQWVATNNYDSADSYAATFLSLVLAYSRASGDQQFMRQYSEQLVSIAEVLIKLQDSDGLMWAKPGYYVKFLMDNSENYRGLADAAELMRQLGNEELARRYDQAAGQVAQGIEQRLWSSKRQSYAWALYGRWWARQPVDRWYPDTIAQVYPIVFGVVPADGPRAEVLYQYLNDHYPNWVSGEFDDRFPWAILALVAATMQDKQRAVAYLDNVSQQSFAPAQGTATYPWYAGESAFLLQAWQLLKLEVPAFANLDQTEEAEQEPVDANRLGDPGQPEEGQLQQAKQDR